MIITSQLENNLLEYRISYAEETPVIGLLRILVTEAEYQILGIMTLPEYREQGIATDLLNAFLAEISADPGRVLPVSVFYPLDKDTQDIDGFFRSRNDFLMMESGRSYEVNIPDLLASPFFRKYGDKQPSQLSLGPLSETSPAISSQLFKSLEKAALMPEAHDEDLSFAMTDPEGKKLLAGLLARRLSASKVSVEALYSGSEAGIEAVYCIIAFVKKISALMPHGRVQVCGVTTQGEALLDKLTANMENVTIRPIIAGIWDLDF